MFDSCYVARAVLLMEIFFLSVSSVNESYITTATYRDKSQFSRLSGDGV